MVTNILFPVLEIRCTNTDRTIPFAAIVTPGSLTVNPLRSISTVHSYVPQPAFDNSTNFGSAGEFGYLESTPLIYKLAYNTASAWQPVALSSEYQNETYGLSFTGPAVKCASANHSMVREMTKIYSPDSYNSAQQSYQYLSWVPGTDPGYSSADFGTLDSVSHDAARIFVLTTIGDWNNSLLTHQLGRPVRLMLVNVTECQLYNAIYEVEFAFRYPNQTRHATVSKWLHPVPPYPWYLERNAPQIPNMTDASVLSYSSMMQAFGKLLVGDSSSAPYTVAKSFFTSWQILNINWSESTAIQSGLESLFQNFTLSLLSSDNFMYVVLCTFLTSINDDAANVRCVLRIPKTQASLVPVTTTTYPITYTYSPMDLLLPYGLALGAALLCAAIGSYAFFVNNASYQNIFSSFLRATSGHETHALLDPISDGSDPLPKHLGKLRITVGSSGKHS